MNILIATFAEGATVPSGASLVDCYGNRYVVARGGHYANGAPVPVLCAAGADIPKAGTKLTWCRATTGCAAIATVAPFDGLSEEARQLCKDGHFEEKDLVPFLPALEREIATYGAYVVVSRCQIARANCATSGFAIECVKRYFELDPMARATSEMARKAMTKVETHEAQDAAWKATIEHLHTATMNIGIAPRPS
jgi:hypothetical protein